jgi:signal transduction histidine kinase
MARDALDDTLQQLRSRLREVASDDHETRALILSALDVIEAEGGRRCDVPPRAADVMSQRIAELEEAVAARDEFIATVAHELRNPLSPLVFQARLLLDRLEAGSESAPPITPEWTRGQVRRFEHQLHRVLETLDRLLDLSRLSSGRIDLRLDTVDLGDVVRDVLAAFEGELAVAQCPVRVQERRRAEGQWDRIRVEQVCSNLISNAIRYGAGQPIDIVVDAGDQFATLEVRDYGVGISREDQQRIFERFERVQPDRRAGGFGVGLWVARSICAAFGGTITVESEPGHGARFCVVLPRHHVRTPDQSARA